MLGSIGWRFEFVKVTLRHLASSSITFGFSKFSELVSKEPQIGSMKLVGITQGYKVNNIALERDEQESHQMVE